MKSLALTCALFCVLFRGATLYAQATSTTGSSSPAAASPTQGALPAKPTIEPPGLHKPTAEETAAGEIAKPMVAALRLRITLANEIFSETTKPEEGLAKLRADLSPSGLRIDSDADFSYAAIDVGQRLLALGKGKEAGLFFQAAEKSLDSAVKKTPNAQAKDKAQYLQKLALIRGSFLNNPDQARIDIEQAIALQPDDKFLKQARSNLARTNATAFQDKPKG
jgi:hypothetical protein